ncbi:MAG TPA: methyltransferase domain-containing protein [Alphaproteobacteria bacterium]|nr:methyltransferase domain-containing protein [Alphaproteobacteria bacterium]
MKPRSALDNEQPEELLFFRRWIANPLKVGALLPSAPALARLVARNVEIGPDDAVIEVGAGTGSITKALVSAGIPRERLFVIEIDADMCTYLRKQFPQVQVIHGDAGRLSEIVPGRWHGKVSTVVSGIPMITLPFEAQQRLIKSWFGITKPGGQMLQYTYSLISPIPEAKLGLSVRRCGMAFLNVPPASVFSYRKTDAA